MKRNPLLALLLVLLLACSACGLGQPPGAAPLSEGDRAAAQAMLDTQLGLLKDQINEKEYSRCMAFMEQLWPLRQARMSKNQYDASDAEWRLVERLNQLYERYTAKYIGDGGTWGYSNPSEQPLGEYRVDSDGGLTASGSVRESPAWDGADYEALWDRILAILPDDAWRDFSKFTVFTDGPDETLAYVTMADHRGDKWELAVDPADAGDGAWFTETVLHEYTHYLTLNDEQVTYTGRQTADTYNEPGMVSRPDSYINQFYQTFWADYLDDRLANMDTYNFFLRHEDDFVTDYASTDPAEDIAESFTYFLLWEKEDGDAVWQQKLNFFYGYPELVDFRTQVRERLEAEE